MGKQPPRGVTVLLMAQIASQMGDAAFAVLLLWAVVERTDSRLVLGAAATLNYLPILLFGMAGGLAADRFPRRGLMVASDGARALLSLSVPVLALGGLDTPWILAAMGFGLFTASAFFNPARDATIPFLARGGDLVRANALIQLSVPLGWLLGPAACLLFLQWFPTVELFAGVGLLFAVSVAFLLVLPAEPAAPKGSARIAKALFEGLEVIRRDPRLRVLMAITAADNLLIMGPAIVGTPLFAKTVLGGGGGTYALLEASLALGALAGIPLAARLNLRFGQGWVLIGGIFLDGITYLPLLWVRSPWAAALAVGLHGVSIPLITVTRTAFIQRVVPPERMGRVFAITGMMVLGLTALSSGLTGLVTTVVPVPVVFGAIAVLAALCGPAAALSRDFREA